MPFPATGAITLAMIATELGISQTGLSLNDSRVRALAGKASGAIALSDLRGKSNGPPEITLVAGEYSVTVGYSSGASSPAMGSVSGQPIAGMTMTYLITTSGSPNNFTLHFNGDVSSALSGYTFELVGYAPAALTTITYQAENLRTNASGLSPIRLVSGTTYKSKLIPP